MSKYYLYVRTETNEYFLSNNQDHAVWLDIKELGIKKPMLYKSISDANKAMKCLVNDLTPALKEVHLWSKKS